MISSESPLKGKRILVVDDEPDVLETLQELLDMCIVQQAADFDTAVEFISNHSYDAVVLDIQGVNGFELLRHAVSKGFPTLMLTAHAATPESLKKSIELGAVAFLPKEYILELKDLLEDSGDRERQAFLVDEIPGSDRYPFYKALRVRLERKRCLLQGVP